MHRLTCLSLTSVLVLSLASFGCGKKKGPDDPSSKTDTTADKKDGDKKDGDKDGDKKDGDSPERRGGDKKDGDGDAPKKDVCTGFDVGNLDEVLNKSACEVPNAKPDGVTAMDPKGKLEVTVGASPMRAAPGGKVDLIVTFANKSKDPITLNFRIDPTPRYEVEVYDKKNKRIDKPAGEPPPPPKGHSQPPSVEAKVAKVTIAANGSARMKVPWEASKMKWAPEKVRGTPSERGYPRVPAGPLGKGKYTVKVVTPLVGVPEEFSSPKVEIEIGG
jgi:hypothetical protein